MHVLDLGVFQYVVGSFMWELTQHRRKWGGSTRQVRFYQAYHDYKLWCVANGIASVAKRFQIVTFKKTQATYPCVSQKAGLEQPNTNTSMFM